MNKHDRLVWMDLVIAGLDAPEPCTAELACVVTDGDLAIVAEGPSVVVGEPELSLVPADDWRHAVPGATGRRDHVATSSVRQAETELLAFLREHCEPGSAPMAGHTVYRDRPFLRRFMPELDGFLHYRIIDMATVEELARRWYPAAVAAAPGKPESSRALDHIHASIHALRYYRAHIFH